MMKLVIILLSTFCIWNYSFSNEIATSIDNEPIDVMGSYEERAELNNKKQPDLEEAQVANDEIIIDTTVELPAKKDVVNRAQYAPRKKLTRADRLKMARRKLEIHNELLVKKQIEEMRLRQELAMMKKLEAAFEKSMDRLDSIQ